MTWEQEIEEAKQYAREEAREEALEEGREEGLSQGRIETAKNMLMNNISLEMAAKCTGLPLDQVLALQKEICVPVC